MHAPVRRGAENLLPRVQIASCSRCISTTAAVQAKPRRQRQINDPLALRNMGKFEYDDIPTYGHLYLGRQRELLKYKRILQWELPKLAGEFLFLFGHAFTLLAHTIYFWASFLAFRKEFVPPSKENMLRFRSLNYQGEAHPATRKSVVTVQVKDLFESGKLDSSLAARRKLLLLAGVRWDPMGEEINYEDLRLLEKEAIEKGLGMIKISSERFPEERMNLKWCSDTIDKLIEEANVS